jgi:hypothetical protein
MTETTASTATRRPRSRLRIVALTAVVLVGVLVVGYLAAGMLVYDRLSAIRPGCTSTNAANSPAAFTLEGVDTRPYAMPAFEPVTLPSRDPDVAISGWYVPAGDDAAGPAVVVVHGHQSCKRAGRLLLAAGMLHRAGISVLLIDLRNHGDSEVVNGRYAGGTREYRDALGGWDWLVAHGHPADRTGLFGMSLGAATAMIATGEEPRVAAVWEDSGYADTDEAIVAELTRNGYPTFIRYGGYLMAALISGDDLTGLSPLEAMRKLDGRPIAITHGAADRRLSVAYAGALAEAVRATGGSVDPWIVDGSDHTNAVVDQAGEYERRLDAFFESALGN